MWFVDIGHLISHLFNFPLCLNPLNFFPDRLMAKGDENLILKKNYHFSFM